MYGKEAKGLTQSQAIENLKAILGSDYFKTYNFYPNSRISSDIITTEIAGYKTVNEKTVPNKVSDISDAIIALLNGIDNKGTLIETFIKLCPSDEVMKTIEFEKGLYEDGAISLPLSFSIMRERRDDTMKYNFQVINMGFKKSYFESHGFDFKDANKKIANWYREITRNLKSILPHSVK